MNWIVSFRDPNFGDGARYLFGRWGVAVVNGDGSLRVGR